MHINFNLRVTNLYNLNISVAKYYYKLDFFFEILEVEVTPATSTGPWAKLTKPLLRAPNKPIKKGPQKPIKY